MSRQIEAVLQECLERLGQGATVEDCLAAHPAHAAELRPLLLAARAARAASAAEARPEAKAAGLDRVRQAMAAKPVPVAVAEAKVQEILSACVDRMARGATIDDCLASYPTMAAQLRPLLETAVMVQAASRVRPREEARATGRARLARFAERHALKSWRVAVFQSHLRVWASVAAALVVSLGGLGVVQASDGSTPGDILYPVKRTVERGRLAWPFHSNESKARLSEGLARRRAEEMTAIAASSPPKRLAFLSERIEVNVDRSASLSLEASSQEQEQFSRLLEVAAEAGRPEAGQRAQAVQQETEEKLRIAVTRLDREAQQQRERLRAALNAAPPAQRPHVQAAADQVDRTYKRNLEKLEHKLAEVREQRPVPRLIEERRKAIEAARRQGPPGVPPEPRPGVPGERHPAGQPQGQPADEEGAARVPPQRPPGETRPARTLPPRRPEQRPARTPPPSAPPAATAQAPAIQ